MDFGKSNTKHLFSQFGGLEGEMWVIQVIVGWM
jgi:hypothetical protein